MNRRLITRLLIVFITSFSLLGVPLGAYAHDGPPRLELSAGRVNPGAVIEVRGINLAPESTIAIVLARNGLETQLGQVMSDAEGDFVQALALPVDLAEGEYTVRAISHGQTPVSASLKIEGAAMIEEGGQRGEEEPLLAPMPTRAASAAPPLSRVAAAPETAAAGERAAAWLLLPFGMLALAGLALALKRRSAR